MEKETREDEVIEASKKANEEIETEAIDENASTSDVQETSSPTPKNIGNKESIKDDPVNNKSSSSTTTNISNNLNISKEPKVETKGMKIKNPFVHIKPKVAYLVYWENPIHSGTALAIGLSILIFTSCYSLFDTFCFLFVSLVGLNTIYVAGKKQLNAILNQEPINPYNAQVNKYIDEVICGINFISVETQKIVLVDDALRSAKFASLVYFVWRLSSWFSLHTILGIALVLGFAIPKLYLQNKALVDEKLDQANKLTSVYYERTYTISQKKVTPPSVTNTTQKISLCNPLTYEDDDKTPQGDRCANGTYICQIITNIKDKDERIIEVQSIAGEFEERKLDPKYYLEPSQNKEDLHGLLKITLHGGIVQEEQQRANITFVCDKENKEVENPITFKGYKDNVLSLEWTTHSACGTKNPDNTKTLGGFAIFLIIVSVFFGSYLLLGAAYNHHIYNAQGCDLLPHRDFWRSVPQMTLDLISHLINLIKSGGRPGYSRV
ncbi:16340_t:CDS:10 [Entrophospora sp. SA101]|nr:4362_t:CDS:10 [Entrophospora sp. SA101]CAJ0757334.1 16340_t:CDS:10 [Entrophospora sp. SA101]